MYDSRQLLELLSATCCESNSEPPTSGDRSPAVFGLPLPQPPQSRWLPDPSRMTAAADLCHYGRIKLSGTASELLRAEMTPREFFDELVHHECLADARRVLAQALPKRRALWWACLSAFHAYADTMEDSVSGVLEAVVQYVRQPSEKTRRLAAVLGQRVGVNTLAGSLALGVFCSTGSIAPPGLPDVRPRPFVTGRLVGVAVYLASVIRDPRRYREHLHNYLAVGRRIACGQDLWIEAPPAEPLRTDSLHVQPLPPTWMSAGRAPGVYSTAGSPAHTLPEESQYVP